MRVHWHGAAQPKGRWTTARLCRRAAGPEGRWALSRWA